jgi:flagellar biosynthesis/type III secretory pathway protein FliH
MKMDFFTSRQNMAMEPTEKPRVKLACLTMLARLQLDPARKQLISGFIDKYLRLTTEQKEEFDEELEQLIPQEKECVMEIVTSWMQEGMEKGLALGLQQGLEKGLEKGLEQGLEKGLEKGLENERKLVLRLLHKQLGEIGPAAMSEITTLQMDRLEDLGEALLDFRGRGDLDAWLQSHRS